MRYQSQRRSFRLENARGANLVEYIMLVGLIAIACIMSFHAFGESIVIKTVEQSGSIRAIGR